MSPDFSRLFLVADFRAGFRCLVWFHTPIDTFQTDLGRSHPGFSRPSQLRRILSLSIRYYGLSFSHGGLAGGALEDQSGGGTSSHPNPDRLVILPFWEQTNLPP
ncbi:hypothetical protein FA13DRAFT_1740356 [Coprinellus micaceus]|uniref:Uncharacterized protein n=1 Tax=Coprinellus micaceus TaxID=71717 RepID=A0A4Y7SME2_COPMI|nr:hypothetical protein FA13DRAFT_1740356 [Coprinellus micaceus]